MSEGSVFESISRVVLRIDEIKKRFGYGKSPEQEVSFESCLEQVNAKEDAALSLQEGAQPAGDAPESELQAHHALYGEIIEAASEKFRIPASLIKAVIQQESSFDRNAVSNKGAIGLMQLMPKTADVLGVSDPYDAEENIMGGTRYLRELINLYGGNLNRALAAYNAGPERVKMGIPDIRETKDFIATVLANYDELSQYSNEEGFE
jgi:soluble lytic murein transglycosylase-like protein